LFAGPGTLDKIRDAELIPLLAADAIADRVILTTPRLPTVRQVEHLYEEALTWK
jgi:alcohol dehydrogenase class IV